MTAIDWAVEVDADPDTTGQFILDSSALDGPDTLGPETRWIDVGRVLRKVSLRRGRSDESRPYDAGEAVVELDNRTGDFDPDNIYGRYVMLGIRKLLGAGTGLRVKATATTPATMFSGQIETPSVSDSQFDAVATYTSTDRMSSLADVDVPLQGAETGTGETSSDRAKWLLDTANVPASQRSVQASGRQLLGTTGEGSVRDNLQKVTNGEAGRFFVDRTGVVTLTWHDAEFTRTSVATFNDDGTGLSYEGLSLSPGAAAVTNIANVKRTGPRVRDAVTGQFNSSTDIPDVVATDWDSVSDYGPRQVKVETVLLNDSDAQSLATYFATRRSQPTQRLTRLSLEPLETLPAADAQTILELDIGSLITVVRHTLDGRELTFFVTVEGVNIDAVPGLTRVTLTTAPSDTAGLYGGAGWFLLDTSSLDGTDVLPPF